MASPAHHLRRLRLQVHSADQASAQALRGQFEAGLSRRLADVVAAVCEELGPREELLRIDRLDLPLGAFAMEELEREAPLALERALREALLQALAAARHNPAPGQRLLAPAEARLDRLATFLRHGVLPHRVVSAPFAPADDLLALLRADPASLLALLRRLAGERSALERLLLQLDPERFALLLAALAPADAALILAYLADLLLLHQQRPLLPVDADRLRRGLWLVTLTLLLRDAGTPFNRRTFLDQLLRGLAAEHRLPYSLLLRQLEEALRAYSRLQPLGGSLPALLAELIGLRRSLAPALARANRDPEPLLALLRADPGNPELHRALEPRLSAPLFAALVRALEPGQAPLVLAAVADVALVHRQQPLLPLAADPFERLVRRIALQLLLHPTGSPFERLSFLRQLLRQLAQSQRLVHADLLRTFAAALTRLPRPLPLQTSLPALLDILIAEELGDTASDDPRAATGSVAAGAGRGEDPSSAPRLRGSAAPSLGQRDKDVSTPLAAGGRDHAGDAAPGSASSRGGTLDRPWVGPAPNPAARPVATRGDATLEAARFDEATASGAPPSGASRAEANAAAGQSAAADGPGATPAVAAPQGSPDPAAAMPARENPTGAAATPRLPRPAFAEELWDAFLRAGHPAHLGPRFQEAVERDPASVAALLRSLFAALPAATGATPGDPMPVGPTGLSRPILLARLLRWLLPDALAALAAAACPEPHPPAVLFARWAEWLADAPGADLATAWSQLLSQRLADPFASLPALPPLAAAHLDRRAWLRAWLGLEAPPPWLVLAPEPPAWVGPLLLGASELELRRLLQLPASEPAALLLALRRLQGLLAAAPPASGTASAPPPATFDQRLDRLLPWLRQPTGPLAQALATAPSAAERDAVRLRAVALALAGGLLTLEELRRPLPPLPPLSPLPTPAVPGDAAEGLSEVASEGPAEAPPRPALHASPGGLPTASFRQSLRAKPEAPSGVFPQASREDSAAVAPTASPGGSGEASLKAPPPSIPAASAEASRAGSSSADLPEVSPEPAAEFAPQGPSPVSPRDFPKTSPTRPPHASPDPALRDPPEGSLKPVGQAASHRPLAGEPPPTPDDRQRLLAWLVGEGPEAPTQLPTLLRLFAQLADQGDAALLSCLRQGASQRETRRRWRRGLPDALLGRVVLLLQPGRGRLLLDLQALLSLAWRQASLPGDPPPPAELPWDTLLPLLVAPRPLPTRLICERLSLALCGSGDRQQPAAERLLRRARQLAGAVGAEAATLAALPLLAALEPPPDPRPSPPAPGPSPGGSAPPVSPPPVALAEDLYIANAGLVIFNPFLPRFFERLGLLTPASDDGPPSIQGLEARSRAVHLLQWLVDERLETPEPDLALNKVLAGIDLSAPILPGHAASDDDLAIARGLLEAVIQHWPPLVNTSLAGLRETFLGREGRLELPTMERNQWTLVVQRRTVDILMNQRPWPISPVRHRWMPAPLHVDWT